MKLPFPLPKWRTEEDEFPSLWRGAVSEFFACLIFIFVGCGSVVASNETLGSSTVPVDSVIAIALAHGFCIMVLVYSIGEVSGGHINPAVTWACLMTDKISVLRAFVYWISQLTGAVLGAAFLLSILPLASRYNLGCHGLNPHLTPAQGFGAETIFSFIFIFVVFATAISPFAGKFAPLAGGSGDYGPGKLTPFAVGMTILMLELVGVPLTGASMNPARSFGPAIVRGCWANHWIYWIGPLLGSTIAAIVAQVIFLSQPETFVKILTASRPLRRFQAGSNSLHGTIAALTGKTPSIGHVESQQSPQTYSIMRDEEEVENDELQSGRKRDSDADRTERIELQ